MSAVVSAPVVDYASIDGLISEVRAEHEAWVGGTLARRHPPDAVPAAIVSDRAAAALLGAIPRAQDAGDWLVRAVIALRSARQLVRQSGRIDEYHFGLKIYARLDQQLSRLYRDRVGCGVEAAFDADQLAGEWQRRTHEVSQLLETDSPALLAAFERQVSMLAAVPPAAGETGSTVLMRLLDQIGAGEELLDDAEARSLLRRLIERLQRDVARRWALPPDQLVDRMGTGPSQRKRSSPALPVATAVRTGPGWGRCVAAYLMAALPFVAPVLAFGLGGGWLGALLAYIASLTVVVGFVSKGRERSRSAW